MRVNIHQQKAGERDVDDRIGPGVDETRYAPRF
jgi:hypothetical protein